MSERRRINRLEFWLALLIPAITIILIFTVWLGWFRISAIIAGESVHHWLSWLGVGFIGLYLPAYSILKRRYQHKLTILNRIHVFGSLLSFAAIAVHFTHQLTRPPEAFPALGTGIALIVALTISAITGFVLRFKLTGKWYKPWRWFHTTVILSFYIIAIIHILHGARIPGF